MGLQTAAGGNSRLLTMPLEILQQISRYLTTPEYCNLRVTCKHMEASLFQSFSKEFFSKRKFMFTEFSLQALIDISKSRLAPSLTQVIFGIESPSFLSTPEEYTTFDHLSRISDDRVAKRNRLRQEIVDHQALLDTGHFIEMMAEAFKHLGNLETVGMRDFNSRTRYRDGPQSEWQSYGTQTFVRETGVQLQVEVRVQRYFSNLGLRNEWGDTSRLFTGLLHALGKSSARPKRFEIILRHGGLTDYAFSIPKYAEPIVLPVLSKIRALYLDLNSEFVPAIVSDGQHRGCSNYLTRQFLSRVTHLDHLRLNFQGCDSQDFLSWLGTAPSAPAATVSNGAFLESPQPVNFTNLRQLDLGMIHVEPLILHRVLQKYRATLCGISLHKVCLRDGRGSKERVNLWCQLFRHMLKIRLSLNHLLVSFASQEVFISDQKVDRRVSFKTSSGSSSDKMWKGKDLESALKDFADHVVVDWPRPDANSNEDNDDNDDNDDDVDDEDEEEEDDDLDSTEESDDDISEDAGNVMITTVP